MIATSAFLTALECTNFVFERGSDPDPAGGAYSAPPAPRAGPLLLKGGDGRERKGRGGQRREEAMAPLTQIPGSTPAQLSSNRLHSNQAACRDTNLAEVIITAAI